MYNKIMARSLKLYAVPFIVLLSTFSFTYSWSYKVHNTTDTDLYVKITAGGISKKEKQVPANSIIDFGSFGATIKGKGGLCIDPEIGIRKSKEEKWKKVALVYSGGRVAAASLTMGISLVEVYCKNATITIRHTVTPKTTIYRATF